MANKPASNEPGDEDVPANTHALPMAGFIRQRPRMFIGGTDATALHRLAYELIEYSLHEIWLGHGRSIHIQIGANGSLSVADDGRGIPVAVDTKVGISTLEWVMTFSSGVEIRGGERAFRTSLHGIGARAVMAFSDWAEATVSCNGRVYRQRYERGLSVGDVYDIGPAGMQTGTRITFHPDPEIFGDVTFDRARLEDDLRELAFLNKGLIIRLTEEPAGRDEVFHYAGGVADFVEYLNRDVGTLHKPVSIDTAVRDVGVEIAMQYTTGVTWRVRCYANNAYNPVGGTHQLGFQSALVRTLNAYARKASPLGDGLASVGPECHEGLTAIVSIKCPEPLFESQKRRRLNNPEVKGIVTGAVRKGLAKFLNENPEEARRIITKAVAAAKARQAQAGPKERESA